MRKILKVISSDDSSKAEVVRRPLSASMNDLMYAFELISQNPTVHGSNMEKLRKQCISILRDCDDRSEKMYVLGSVGEAIAMIPLNTSDTLYLQQYQFLINWLYFELRFLSEPLFRPAIFREAKERYRKMFALQANTGNLEKLWSYMHWSQLCYEYAECVDDESVKWCMNAIADTTEALTAAVVDANAAYKREHPDDPTQLLALSSGHILKTQRRINDALELIKDNVYKCENIRAMMSGMHSRRQVTRF